MVHLCIFGGTGPSGRCVIEEALSRGYTVTVFARNLSKIPKSITSSNSVTVVRGTLTDRAALTQAIRASDGIIWTIARVAKLTSGNGGNVKAGYIGKQGTGVLLSRKDLGKWYLDELEQPKWTYQMPVIYST